MTNQDHTLYPVTGRFLEGRCRDVMGSEAKAAFESLFTVTQHKGAGDVIAAAFAPHDRTTILISGFAVRSLSDGKSRSIVGVFVPGDILDLPALGFGALDHDVVALGPVTIASADRGAMEELSASNPDVGSAIWAASQLEAALQRQWTVKLGRLKASRRIARVLSELWCRLDLVGLASQGQFAIPMTQQNLADMCGTTAIHMNRALGELRREQLVDVRRGLVTAPDRAALEQFGEFSPQYLTTPTADESNVMPQREYHIAM